MTNGLNVKEETFIQTKEIKEVKVMVKNNFTSYFDDDKGFITKVYPLQNVKRKYFFIGDSITVSAAKKLYDKLGNDINVDAKVGRQFSEAIQILNKYKDILGDVIVIELGTNGDIEKEDLEIVFHLIEDKKIIFINNKVLRVWERNNNNLLLEFSQRYQNIRIIDWHNSINEDRIFQKDGIHLTDKEIDYFVNLILNNL